MSTPNDKEIDYMVGQQIVRARSYEAACKKANVEQALAEEKANQEKIGATVQAARASATQPQQLSDWLQEMANLAQLAGMFPYRINAVCDDYIDARQERDALQAQRDELLVFVRKVNAHLSKHSGTVDVKTACKWSDESDAVIARATEGGTGQ